MPKFKGRYKRPQRLPGVGEFMAGHEVVGIIDGVRILRPVEAPMTFTDKEWREAVRVVVARRGETAVIESGR